MYGLVERTTVHSRFIPAMAGQTSESHRQPSNTLFHTGLNGLAHTHGHDERENARHGVAPGFNPQRIARRLTVNEPPGIDVGSQRFPERLVGAIVGFGIGGKDDNAG